MGSVPLALPPVDFPVGVIAGRNSLNPFFSSLIEGADDGKVSVRSTRVRGMTDHIILPVTHTFMMNNPRVIAQTLHYIENGVFGPEETWMQSVQGLIDQALLNGEDRDDEGQDDRDPEDDTKDDE
jgi:hypothetical protein